MSPILADYWPERPCYHHAGPLSFFVPSELPEGTCSLGPRRELLLEAFSLIFDRVVEQARPADLNELLTALVAEVGRRDGLVPTVVTNRTSLAEDCP